MIFLILLTAPLLLAACATGDTSRSNPTPIPYGTQAMMTLTAEGRSPSGVSTTGSAPMQSEATVTPVPIPTSDSGRAVISPSQAANLALLGFPVALSGQGVQSLGWSADSHLLVVGSATGIEIMDPISGERWMTRMEPAPALNVQFSADGSLIGMVHPEPVFEVHLWNVTDDSVLADWHERIGKPISFAFSPDPDVFATGYPDGKLVIWSFSRSGSLYTYDVAEVIRGGRVTGIDFSPDGNAVAAVVQHADSLAHIVKWDIQTGEILASYDPEDYIELPGPGVDPLLSPDWRYLAWIWDNTVILVDFHTGREARRFVHQAVVQGITISTDSRLIATSSMKMLGGQQAPAVTLWDTTSGMPINDIFSFQSIPPALAFSPDGTLLAIASGEDVQVWGVGSGMEH